MCLDTLDTGTANRALALRDITHVSDGSLPIRKSTVIEKIMVLIHTEGLSVAYPSIRMLVLIQNRRMLRCVISLVGGYKRQFVPWPPAVHHVKRGSHVCWANCGKLTQK